MPHIEVLAFSLVTPILVILAGIQIYLAEGWSAFLKILENIDHFLPILPDLLDLLDIQTRLHALDVLLQLLDFLAFLSICILKTLVILCSLGAFLRLQFDLYDSPSGLLTLVVISLSFAHLLGVLLSAPFFVIGHIFCLLHLYLLCKFFTG